MSIPLTSIACTIDATGISAPSYADILATLIAQYEAIYGSDISLDPGDQDYQWLAIQAAAQNDTNNATILAYDQFSPTTAIGAGLSSIVKTNGLAREIASNSTADLTLVGAGGTPIVNGVVSDGVNSWALPALVTIPGGGTIVATATCTTLGAVPAAANAINQISNPQRGWQTATNLAAATPGAPIELDATLRQRQAVSTSLPATTPLGAITAAIANLAGVTRYMPYENNTGATDGNGVPAHSISLVVEGGDAAAIAGAIAAKKIPGGGTYGTTNVTVVDPSGVSNVIHFFRPTVLRLVAEIDLTALSGYVSTTAVAMQAALAAYVSGLAIGTDVYNSKAEAAANLPGDPLSLTFNLTAVKIGLFGGAAPSTADYIVAFNAAASLAVADITVVAV